MSATQAFWTDSPEDGRGRVPSAAHNTSTTSQREEVRMVFGLMFADDVIPPSLLSLYDNTDDGDIMDE